MAYDGGSPHAEQVHTGPSPQNAPSPDRCCGTPVQVVSLSGGSASVDLVRCGACGASLWRVDGADVPKSVALSTLSRAYSSPAVRPAPPRRTAARPPRVAPVRPTELAADQSAELAALLASWQVLPTTR